MTSAPPSHQCLFCENWLGPETKPEHILLSALGGRKTTKLVLCSECNGRFGSTIDRALADQVPVLRNMFQMRSGTGSPPPGIPSVRSGSSKVTLRSDGTPELRQKPFEVKPKGDGTFEVAFSVRSIEELERYIPNVAAIVGTTTERIWEQVKGQVGKQVSSYPDPYMFSLQAGGEDAIRSMAKSCLALLACLIGVDEVRRSAFFATRDFVVKGSADFNYKQTAIDARLMDEGVKNALVEAFGPLFNLIYVKSDPNGRTVGYFVLYNIFAWQIVLSEAGGPPDVAVALASNPLDPVKWSDKAADDFPIDFDWLDHPNETDLLAVTQTRVLAAMEKFVTLSRERTIRRILDEVLPKYYQPGEMMGGDDRWRLATAETSQKVASAMLRLSSENPIAIEGPAEDPD